MTTILGEALKKAQEGDINSYKWKLNNNQEIRMMDMSEAELNKAYNHCQSMLWNTSQWSPGKYEIRKRIEEIRNNCNAELFLRYILHELDITYSFGEETKSIKTNWDLIEFINLYKKENNVSNDDYITALFQNVHPIYEKITIDKLLSACLDKLGILNRKMISDKFILAQGIWLTHDEKKELTEYDNGKLRDRLEVIKERLVLNQNIQLRINTKGFSYKEFRSLVRIEDNNPKISELATDTLHILRDKVLMLLNNDLNYHIEKWNKLISQLEKVGEYKRINLCQDC